jgi:ribosomal protein S21|tara:strand:- start:357 stop:578 length:222 start_codon:yes stop_codon:yes gene_type:complete
MAVNLKVVKKRGESDERLIRRFNRKCKKQKIVQEYRQKTDYHIKPSITKRLKRQKAIREQQKLVRKEQEKLFR